MRPRSLPAAALVLMLLGCALAAQSKRSITETDLFQFTWIGDPQVSPDGSSVAFVRVSVNAKKDGYDTAHCLSSRRLVTSRRDGSRRGHAIRGRDGRPTALASCSCAHSNETANRCRHSSIFFRCEEESRHH
jgi:hypothetical protein